MGVEGYTEFDGGGVMPNTVYPKGPEALTNSDKLRLQSLTGQDTDPRAPLDPYHWYGNAKPNIIEEQLTERTQQQKANQIRKRERNRYKESRG